MSTILCVTPQIPGGRNFGLLFILFYFSTDQLCRDREFSITTNRHGWSVASEPLCCDSPQARLLACARSRDGPCCARKRAYRAHGCERWCMPVVSSCHNTISMSRHKAFQCCPRLVTTQALVATLVKGTLLRQVKPLSRLESPSPNPKPCRDTKVLSGHGAKQSL